MHRPRVCCRELLVPSAFQCSVGAVRLPNVLSLLPASASAGHQFPSCTASSSAFSSCTASSSASSGTATPPAFVFFSYAGVNFCCHPLWFQHHRQLGTFSLCCRQLPISLSPSAWFFLPPSFVFAAAFSVGTSFFADVLLFSRITWHHSDAPLLHQLLQLPEFLFSSRRPSVLPASSCCY